MKAMKILVHLLVFASLAWSQTAPAPTPEIVNFQNDTPSDSPILVESTAKRSPNSRAHGQYFCCVKAHNPTGQGLIAYVFEFQMNGFDGKAWKLTVPHDYFIAGEEIPALTGDFFVKFPCDRGKPSSMKLTFAQLEDGMTWGENPAEEMIMAERAGVQDYLAQLKLAYLNGGATALNAKLDEPVKGLSVLLLQKHLQDARSKDGVDAVPAAIDNYASITKAHAVWIKP